MVGYRCTNAVYTHPLTPHLTPQKSHPNVAHLFPRTVTDAPPPLLHPTGSKTSDCGYLDPTRTKLTTSPKTGPTELQKTSTLFLKCPQERHVCDHSVPPFVYCSCVMNHSETRCFMTSSRWNTGGVCGRFLSSPAVFGTELSVNTVSMSPWDRRRSLSGALE